MLISLALTMLCAALMVIMAITYMATRSKGLALAAIIVAGLGLFASAGMAAGYAFLGATDQATVFVFLFGASFLPVLAGSIGMRTGAW